MDIESFSNFAIKINEKIKLSSNIVNDISSPGREKSLNYFNKKLYNKCAVIIFCFPDSCGEICFPLIQRQIYDGVHSGQISLPGGKKEPSDSSLWKTSKRELNEELGVDVSSVRKIRKLTEVIIPPSNFLVTPYVAYINYSPNFIINKREVGRLIIMKIQDLIYLKRVRGKVSNSYLKDVLVPGFRIKNNFIWGATAMILREFQFILNSTVDKILYLNYKK